MKVIPVLFLLIMFGFSGCKEKKSSFASASESSKPDEILDLLNEKKFNGSYLIKDHGTVILHGALGYRDFATKDSLHRDHQFYLASLSKQITAMACLILEQRGQLRLDDKLSDYFPEIVYADQVSIDQLLTHTSGIPDYYELGIYKAGMKNDDVYKALLNDTALDFEPGSQYKYSNSAYVLLSMVEAKAAGQSFKEFIHQNIFSPLGMKNSVVFDETTEAIPIRAVGHTEGGEKQDYHAYTTGGGGIFSTTGDLALWEAALYTDKLIPQSLLTTAYQPTTLSNGDLSYYGYGWAINEGNPDKVSHTGSLEGFRNLLSRDLGKNRLIVFLTNNSNSELTDLAIEVEKILDKPVLMEK